MRTITILNPAAAGGLAAKRWEKRKRLLGPESGGRLMVTAAPGDAAGFARRALEDGIGRIFVVGGDGTFNEVLNGYIRNDQPINPEAVLLPVAAGTGNDFSRLLASRPARPEEPLRLDVGKVTHSLADGGTAVRYFANVASCGQSAAIAGARFHTAFAARLGGKAAYFLSALKSLWSYQPSAVEISAGGATIRHGRVRLVAVANGRTFGGGIAISPASDPADGELNLTVVGDSTPLWLLRHAAAIYRGEHRHLKHISHHRAPAATIAATDSSIALETDGEVIGQLPATFEVIAKALRVAVPAPSPV